MLYTELKFPITFFKAASKATQRAFEPQIIPSAYCNPNLMIAGCITELEKLNER